MIDKCDRVLFIAIAALCILFMMLVSGLLGYRAGMADGLKISEAALVTGESCLEQNLRLLYGQAECWNALRVASIREWGNHRQPVRSSIDVLYCGQ